GRDLSARLQHALAVVFGALGVLGAWRHWKADFRTAFAMTALVGTFTLLLIFYLNFKYGYSQMLDHPQLAREVRERDYFFIASFALWGVWVGMGLATLMEWITDWLEEREPDAARRWLTATPVLLLALIPLAGNHLTASRLGEGARDLPRPGVAQAHGEAARLHRAAGRGAAAGVLARAEDRREPGRRHGHPRPAAAGSPVPGARGRHRAAGDQGPDGEASDLFLAHGWSVCGPVRPDRSPRGPGLRAQAAPVPARRVRQHQAVAGAGLGEPRRHQQAA